MKKILYVTTVSRTINAFLVPHINALLENGYHVDCATSIDKEIDSELIKKGVNVYPVTFSRIPLSFGNLKAFKEIIKIQKKNNYDIIHVHTPIASIYGRLLKLRFKNIKTIYTAHGYHFFKGASKISWLIYYPIEWVMAKFTDVTININKEDYEITKKRLKPKKCYLINGVGIDLNKYKSISEKEKIKKRKELGIDEEDFVIIMIAELNENKNQIQMIKAMEIIKNNNIKVLCVGEGNKYDELINQIKKSKLEKQIKLLGFRNDINDLINISDIGVLLSYREGLPRNLMELMANGKRIMGTNIRGCRDLICKDYIGSLVEVSDYEATAMAIKEFYDKRYLNKKLEDMIRQECKEQYDIKPINKKLINIYEKLILEDEYNGQMSSHFTNE